MHGPVLVPEHAITRTTLRVRFCETDLMGIVHHSNYLRYFETGRVEWLRRRAVNYAKWASEGLHLAVVETGVRHRAPARFDDLLEIETRLHELGHVSLRFEYAISVSTSVAAAMPASDGEAPAKVTKVAEGFVRLACIDNQQALRRFPDYALEALQAAERVAVREPTTC